MATSRFSWATLARHQMASLIATAVDFGTLITLVELAKISPVLATLVGASLGALVNFTLNRTFAFRATQGALPGQAVRYGVVSGASALWNALGEFIGTSLLGLPYLGTRIVVAVLVSIGWNFPMHRSFVFRVPSRAS